MSFTSSINKENQEHYNDTIEIPQPHHGNTLQTITGQSTNRMVVHSEKHDPYPYHHRRFRSCSENNFFSEPLVDEHPAHFRSLFEVPTEDSDDYEDFDEVDRMLPGVLAEGTAYTVKETIFQGYIEKKGSGFDWIGSRAWKKRWAVLVKARTDGHDVDVPLLQIFWDYNSPTPSTVISLDSAVLLPENNVDATKPDNNHPYRFKIRHVKKSVNPEISLQLTRILGCSEANERDEWVYAINQALLNYEKEKASARKLSSQPMSPPCGSYRSWANEDVMPQTKRTHKRAISSPPRIPLRPQKYIPR